MEIKEVVSYFLNTDTNVLEVYFRTIDDTEDVLRNANIDYSISSEYGFELETDTFDLFEDEDFDDDFSSTEKIELDEELLISFLNEYYTLNPSDLPKAEFF